MNMLSRTKVYGRVKNLFPLAPATAHPRSYMGKFVRSTKVTL
jgi:transposase